MNSNYKKQNYSRLSYYFLTYFIAFLSIFFLASFSLVAEPPTSSSDTGIKTTPTETADSIKKDLKNTPSVKVTDTEAKKASDTAKNVEEKTNEDLAKKEAEFLKQIKELENQRRKLSFEIYQLRVKLIKEDPELQSLQRSIMDMHRKMASKLNEKNSIKVLLDKATQIDSQIVETINKNKNLDSKEKNNNESK